MHISVAMPILEAEWQPTFRLEKLQYPDSFNKICVAFDGMWDESRPPDDLLMKEKDLEIEFGKSGRVYCESILDRSVWPSEKAWRQIWWVIIRNNKRETVSNVKVRIEDIQERPRKIIADGNQVRADQWVTIPQHLKFGNPPSRDSISLAYKQEEVVHVVSHVDAMLIAGDVRIEGTHEVFYAAEKCFLFTIIVTGDGVDPTEKELRVAVVGRKLQVSQDVTAS